MHYAQEASYPVYILHQTVIVLVAYCVVAWQADVAAKYIAILLLASVGTRLLYEALLRRFNAFRFQFGDEAVDMAHRDM
jgi:peptidoglycan/LPS O-acetylase OafA/YrhL